MLPAMRSRISSLVSADATAYDVAARSPSKDAVHRSPRACSREQRVRRRDLARSAVAALKSVVLEEGPLQRMQFVAVGDALDRSDVAPVDRGGERQATEHALTVDVHRAGAAQSVVAALLGAGQVQPFAQQVEQRGADVGRTRCVTSR